MTLRLATSFRQFLLSVIPHLFLSVILNAVKSPRIFFCRCLLFALPAASAHAATTLDHIRQTNLLRCGINVETPEYSTSDDHGAREAFDADICKAVATAILGPNARTRSEERRVGKEC